MYISTKDWTAFVRKLSKINQAAADAVRDYVLKNGFGDVDALIRYSYAIADKYGTASGTLSAMMYDAIAEVEGMFYPAAEIAANPTYGEVARAIHGTLKTSQNAEEIAGSVSRLVKMVGQDTLIENGMRDGAEFAWIPSGDTCAFCLMLASNGWQPISKSALEGGHATHIHANCDCTYMVRHSQRTQVRGYDPGRYKRIYDNADGNTWQAKLNSMRREFYEENKEEINEQKRSAYAKMKARESSEAEELDV